MAEGGTISGTSITMESIDRGDVSCLSLRMSGISGDKVGLLSFSSSLERSSVLKDLKTVRGTSFCGLYTHSMLTVRVTTSYEGGASDDSPITSNDSSLVVAGILASVAEF